MFLNYKIRYLNATKKKIEDLSDILGKDWGPWVILT